MDPITLGLGVIIIVIFGCLVIIPVGMLIYGFVVHPRSIF